MESFPKHFAMMLSQDLKFGLRMLTHSPGFTVVAVITLALGIGANVAVFSLIDTLMLRPLPYVRSSELFAIFPVERKSGRAMTMTSYPNFVDWQERSHTFAAMAAFKEESFDLSGSTEPERVKGLCSTPGLFSLLGIHPVLGREFSQDDDQHVAVLSFEIWRRHFSSDPEIVGKSVQLNRTAYTVVGVFPAQFYFPPHRSADGLAPEIFVPVVPNPDRGWNYLRVVGRLAPTTTEQQARSELNGVAAHLSQIYPPDQSQTIALDRLGDIAVSDVRQTAWVLLGAVSFVLFIACVNVSNLLLGQAAAREREIAIRSMLGATWFRLVQQLFTEGLLLAGLGGLLGLAFAHGVLPFLIKMVPANSSLSSRIHDIGVHLDFMVLTFSALLSVLSILLFGSLPAWKAVRPLQNSITAVHASKPFSALIAVEVALSFILLTGTGVMLKSLSRLLETNVGFDTNNLLTMDVYLTGAKYASPEKQTAFVSKLLGELESFPSVLSVGAATDLPLTQSFTRNGFEIPDAHSMKGLADYYGVSSDYFGTMGIPLLDGRAFTHSDLADSPLVGVINAALAHHYFVNQNPVGRTLMIYLPTVAETTNGTTVRFTPHKLEIVGIVGDVKQVALDAPPVPELFIPYTQWPSTEVSLVLRTRSTAPIALMPIVEKEVRRLDPDVPVTNVKSMNELVAAEIAGRRFVLQLIGAFASIAVVLAAVGIYGVVSYGVRQRTHEIAIRIALGATREQILRTVVLENAKWLLVGLISGIAGAFATMRLLVSYLYEVQPYDPLIFILVAFVLVAVAFTASYVPARRATEVDPMVALRCQ